MLWNLDALKSQILNLKHLCNLILITLLQPILLLLSLLSQAHRVNPKSLTCAKIPPEIRCCTAILLMNLPGSNPGTSSRKWTPWFSVVISSRRSFPSQFFRRFSSELSFCPNVAHKLQLNSVYPWWRGHWPISQ